MTVRGAFEGGGKGPGVAERIVKKDGVVLIKQGNGFTNANRPQPAPDKWAATRG